MPSAPLVAILEDDDASAEALAIILADWGAEVVRALGTDELCTKLGPRLSDLGHLISDFNIEGHPNGVEAAKALRARSPQTRILILTGTFRRRADAVVAAAGFDIMFKPARADEIIAWLEAKT